jgi:C-terminal processing protease CtpA/Prc
MRIKHPLLWFGAVISLLVSSFALTTAQNNEIPPAVIKNDEGGPVSIVGDMTYTNLLLTSGIAEPLMLLEDEGGFVKRDQTFQFPPESQVLGQFTSDFYSSPASFSFTLPIEPKATLNDVDQDGQSDTGVMIYSVALWSNIFGDPFLDKRDQGGGGWSSDYASMRVDPGNLEVFGGKFLLYTPDARQGFPSGFGEDGKLFTEDDPIVGLPQGYTVVDMDTTPFTFDRSREARIDTIESPGAAAADFSNMGYTAAFDAMIEKLRKEYAFTEFKQIDWDGLVETFRPRFEQAEKTNDVDAYALALRDFTWSIPDGHVGLGIDSQAIDQEFAVNTAGGLGMSLVELDDKRVLVNFVLDGGPAQEAGIALRSQITEINRKPVDEVISSTLPYSSPFSSDHARRLQQVRYAIRFPVDEPVQITFQNPDDSEPQTATLTTIEERDSFRVSSFARGLTGFEPPVEFRVLDSGYGYLKIFSFSDNEVLTVQTVEYFLSLMNQIGIPGIVIDMRQNGGGSGLLADQIPGYFFDEPFITGYTGYYSEQEGAFVVDPSTAASTYPAPEAKRYTGNIVILVGPACASACEFFSYVMTHNERAAIVGQYPTAGLGGSVNDFLMPEGAQVRYTKGRAVDPDGNIHIEGQGVAPTVDVPVNEETAFSDGDPILEAAVAYLDTATQ